MRYKNPSKHHWRNLNHIEIEDQLRVYNESKLDFDCNQDRYVEENNDKEPRKYHCNLYDLINNRASTSNAKKRIPSTRENEISSTKYSQDQQIDSSQTSSDVDLIESSTSFEYHDFSKASIHFLKKLQYEYPSLHISRLGSYFRGSVRIVCYDYRIAFLLIWNVNRSKFDIQIIPIVNCSQLGEKSLQVISNNITNSLYSKFGEEIDIQDNGKSFCALSSFIVSHVSNIRLQLSKEMKLLSKSEDVKKNTPFESVLKKSNINVGHSLDYFDILTLSKEDFAPLIKKKKDKNVIDSHTCLICFDTFQDDDVYLTTCDHKACRSCWKTLLRVSSSSGNALICCPAYKCNQALNMRDAAHLLFDNVKQIDNQDVITLMNLVRFQMDHNLLSDPKVQHCSMPSCDQIFRIQSSYGEGVCRDDASHCVDVYTCNCGALICSNCKQPSHIGISCEASKRLRKEVESGRMDAELKSLQWLQKNTSPCPRCKFSINKNGGCNHVRCGKCNYYFCWICGGDGMNCGSYFCKNAGVVTFGQEDVTPMSHTEVALASQVGYIKNYAAAIVDLEDFFKRHACENINEPRVKSELRLRNILLWTRGYALSKSLSFGWKKSEQKNISNTTTLLEVALEKLLETPEERTFDSILKSEEVLVKPVKRYYNRKKKNVSKPLRKLMMQQNAAAKKQASLEDILHVTKVLSMSENKLLNKHIPSILEEAMEQLQPVRRKGSDNHVTIATDNDTIETCVLNKRMRPLIASWKGEKRFLEPNATNTSVKDKNIKRERSRTQWKGKTKVSARRMIALQCHTELR